MLQKQAVPAQLLAVLEEVSPIFNRHCFYLAGGTALALRLGHRLSVDLDFFSQSVFSVEELEKEFSESIAGLMVISKTKGSICMNIEGVKVEAFHYPNTLLEPTEFIDQVCYASVIDNAAMKLSALVNRGSKKDFCDIAALLEHFSLKQLISFYDEKYPNSNPFIALTSLSYFQDADEEADPEFLLGQTWEGIKLKISKHLKEI